MVPTGVIIDQEYIDTRYCGLTTYTTGCIHLMATSFDLMNRIVQSAIYLCCMVNLWSLMIHAVELFMKHATPHHFPEKEIVHLIESDSLIESQRISSQLLLSTLFQMVTR